MADIRVNLDTLVSKYIHRPIITGKDSDGLPPLYARTGLESETTFDSEGMKNPKWQAASQTTYNSPTNIRRLFIGDNKVFIQYYQPYITNGKSSGKYWVEYSYSNEDNIGKLVRQIISGGTPDENGKVSRVSFSRTGIGALSSHWKVSNIEELYITPSILLSGDIATWIPSAGQLFKAMITANPGSIFNKSIALDIFEKVNGDNIKNIRSRYPRLRVVGFITNIEQMMAQPNAQNMREGLPSTIAELGVIWLKHAVDLGINKCGAALISPVPFENKGPCVEFSVRPGIYRFDAEVLSQYADKYKEKVLELGRKQRDINSGKAGQAQEEGKHGAIEKSQLEVYLDSLEDKYSKSMITDAIRLGFSLATNDEINAEFNKMTPEGKAKYREMLGR